MTRVLIVGATSAIATAVAHRYANAGAQLFLIGRNPDKLAQLCNELGAAVVGSLSCDLDQTEANADRLGASYQALGTVDVAILAHGLLGDQLETEDSYDAAHRIITTNFSSMVSLLIPLANRMEAAQHGQVAVLSSVAGERGRPRNYTYGAAKGALTIYLQGLRSRLYDSGVGVYTFKLGPVDTPMTVDHDKNASFSTVERVADDIVSHLGRSAGPRYVPWFWGPIMAVVRHMPEPLFQRIGSLSGR